jgi:integrase/recombinase XerD
MLGHRSVESTQVYTQVSIRALQAVHAGTHPAEQREEEKTDRKKNNSHNDTTIDTTKGVRDEYNPLQDR